MYHVLHRHCAPRHPPSALICFFRVFTCDTEKTILSYVCSLAYYISRIRLLSCRLAGDSRPPVAVHLRSPQMPTNWPTRHPLFKLPLDKEKTPAHTRGLLERLLLSLASCVYAPLCPAIWFKLRFPNICFAFALTRCVAYVLPASSSRATFA